jgi:hypothetical protein
LTPFFPCRGWCPKGRRAEDGPIDPRYPLTETEATAYEERTERNVLASEGTLILQGRQDSPGTRFTVQPAARYGKPCLVVAILDNPDPAGVRQWADEHNIRVINVAGPRESLEPGIYNRSRNFLREILAQGISGLCW